MKTLHDILCMILLTIMSFLFISGCSAKSGPEGKAWFQCASKYDQAMNQMWSSGLMTDLNEMLKMRQKYLQISQPSEAEIMSVLRSSSRNNQRVALAAMSIKPIETDQMADVLFEFLQDQDQAFRWHAVQSLDKFSIFSEIKQADLGGRLLEIGKARKECVTFPEVLALLAKFPSEATADFLTEQLMKEGETRTSALRNVAFRALKEMGGSYYDKAAEDVYEHGSPEIKKDLLKLEKYSEEKKH